MDHYADDLPALVRPPRPAATPIHVGHSTGGGEVVRYIARHGESRAAKAGVISAVPPLMVQTEANPEGLPKSVFDDLQAQLPANRSEFYREIASGPFYNFDRHRREAIRGDHRKLVAPGHDGRRKAHYDGIVAFSQTDFTEDLKKITVPVLVMHARRRPDRPLRGVGPEVGRAAAERDAQDLSGLPARHADDPARDDQRGPARLIRGAKPGDRALSTPFAPSTGDFAADRAVDSSRDREDREKKACSRRAVVGKRRPRW